MGPAKSIITLIVMSCCIITQAAAGDFVLHIFGNANMDDRIDENDLEFIQMIIQGEKNATDLCDADHNGVVDTSDISQVERIINGTATEINVIDSDGKVVTLPQPLERLVIYNHQCAEVLQLMGVDDRVVGVRDTFAEQRNRFPRLSQVTSIGSGGEPNIEAILKVNPQVVLAYTFYPAEDVLDAKLPPEVKVLRLDCECSGIGPDAMREKITMMGYIFGTRDRAEKYLKWHDAIVSQVEERVKTIPEDNRVRVYLESTPEGKNPQTSRTAIGSGHAANKLVEMAGGVNIAAGHLPKYLDTPTEYGEIETEWVISQNPDVIVGRAMGKGIRPYENDNSSALQSYDREIRSLPGFDKVKAVQDGRVYIITNDYAVTPNYPSALLALAKWFYPDLFQDVDPVATHQEYVNMMGLDFDVRTRGAFTFHAGNST
ncbi:MAG TPA: ABC transporter substrate-binding protein [Methanothrix sp.]|nr:ABC transporter substrate-binding protein [Methanothrix sp.]HOK58050.1 ABC transporter substrate-binding protein [Methanothrix sp.]HOL43453.1 ABC transporter substrate-binding protein [Methanothrix sp.]HPO88529.1 ABC transporter substrate-binding protein [Methanothrix sp.]